jgi:hypothetical protein
MSTFGETTIKKITGDILWWAGVIGLLLLSQTRIEALLYLFQETWLSALINQELLETDPTAIATVVTPVRGLILLFSLCVLAYPIFQDIRQSEVVRNSQIKSNHVLQAILLFVILCVIFTPAQIGGLAEEYSNTSLVMFTRMSTVSYHQRFLMPAIANILFFRGDLFSLSSAQCFLFFYFDCGSKPTRFQSPFGNWSRLEQ